MSGVRVVGRLDRSFGWDGQALVEPDRLRPGASLPRGLRGAAATVEGGGGGWRVVRDPLGLNKLFFAAADDALMFAGRPRRLIDEGFALADIRAVPRGAVVDLPGDGEAASLVPEQWSSPRPAEPSAAADAIRGALDAYLRALAGDHGSARVFVCLSGGLDSSGVAALAREHFPGAVAVSFDLVGEGGTSDDRRAGQHVAQELGMPLLEADVDADELLSELDTVLVEGIDWRDFNVHAALVNAALARAMRGAAGGADALVLTGDLPNELLVDYQAESHRGETYYELPRLPPAALRTSLVRGLDSCHREIGVFEAFGLAVVQPYAVAVDAYLSLDEDFLRLPDRKERLCRMTFGDRLPALVYERPKARAQVGGEGSGGVLGACLDRGVDGAWLRGRFAELHEVDDARALDRFIRGGRYRSAIPTLDARP